MKWQLQNNLMEERKTVSAPMKWQLQNNEVTKNHTVTKSLEPPKT